jgi:hypothetical protein
MRTEIAVGAALLLTLGSAVAGSFLYSQERAKVASPAVSATVEPEQVTPAMIAAWKQDSSTADYIAPRVPI